MITEEKTREQLARLFCLPFCPTDPDSIALAVREFQRQVEKCRDDAQLERVIDRMMDEFKRFPAPADIRDVLAEVRMYEFRNSQIL